MSANVQSLESVREFRAALVVFIDRVADAVSSIQDDVFHALDWLEHDRPRYWHQAVLQAHECVSQARIQMEVARMRKETEGYRPSLIEEKQALREAKERLAFCQQKVEIVKSTVANTHHEADEFTGRLSRLQHLLDTDLPRLVAVLDRMIAALEAYSEGVSEPVDAVTAAPQHSPPETPQQEKQS